MRRNLKGLGWRTCYTYFAVNALSLSFSGADFSSAPCDEMARVQNNMNDKVSHDGNDE